MKQFNMFGSKKQEAEPEKKYSTKIQAPVYEPKNSKPDVILLYDNSKTNRLIREINSSGVTDAEKKFLIEAAKRHTVFNYEKIADYYAHSNAEMQGLMEKSALVILDFEKAIQLGYVRLCDKIRTQYLEEFSDE